MNSLVMYVLGIRQKSWQVSVFWLQTRCILVSVLQRNRTNKRERDLLWELAHSDHGGWDMPGYAIRKLENQKIWRYNSFWDVRPENQGAAGVSPGVQQPENQELRCLKAGEYERPSSRREGGASLVAQWLRICLPMQGTRVWAPVQEDPTCRGAAGPVSHNYWACASGACAPQQERPRYWEARAPRWKVAPARRN